MPPPRPFGSHTFNSPPPSPPPLLPRKHTPRLPADKILQSMSSNEQVVTVTNDGATILKSIYIDNAAAKVLVEISKTQDDEVGDGTTSVVVLAGELLREAEKMVGHNFHPMTIIDGWRIASKIAGEALEAAARDYKEDAAAFREVLMNVARTTLSSKILSNDKDHFATLAVDAVLRLDGDTNLDLIQVRRDLRRGVFVGVVNGGRGGGGGGRIVL